MGAQYFKNLQSVLLLQVTKNLTTPLPTTSLVPLLLLQRFNIISQSLHL
jgi:hypothetical protein